MWFGMDGKPMSVGAFYKKYESVEKRRVKLTALLPCDGGKPIGIVSTVLLGLDHSMGGRPLIFETMVFTSESGADIDMQRYCTVGDAERGHDEIVGLWARRISLRKIRTAEELKNYTEDK